MDISDKKTVLDDSASIYQKREEKSNRAKWKELKGFRAKWDHFRAYYLLKTFIWACVIALLGYGIYEIVAPEKETLLYVAVLDGVVTYTTVENLQDGYEEYMSLDEETQETLFDNSIMISDTSDAASAQKFTVHAFAGEIDMLLASETVIRSYAGHYVLPLSEKLPADLYETLSDRFCYARAVDDSGKQGEELPYGIYIDGLIDVPAYQLEPLVLTICGNAPHGENAEEFIRYLLKQEEKTQKEE